MRIAEVAPPWLAVPPTGYGGVEWVVARVTDGLVRRRHEVTLFATGDSVTLATLDAVVPEAPGPGRINDVVLDTLHAMHAFRHPERFDACHVHAPFSALAAASGSGLPTVHTLHGAMTPEMRELYAEVGPRVWFVAISEAQRAQMPELRYAGVVYNGIDVDGYPFVERKDDYVLFLGRAAPEKGVRRAVLAAREAGLPIVLAVKVSEPEERAHWRDDVEPVLGDDAVVLGEVSLERKLELLSRARAVLFPITWDEPFGLVMTEAMACGTPVIATPFGSVPEVVDDGRTGFVVPAEDYPEEAAAALRRIGEIDARECREHVRRRFSVEAMVDGYERAFELAISTAS